MISFVFHPLITSELESTKLATSQSLCGKEAARMEKVFWKLCYQSIAIIIIIIIIVVVQGHHSHCCQHHRRHPGTDGAVRVKHRPTCLQWQLRQHSHRPCQGVGHHHQ